MLGGDRPQVPPPRLLDVLHRTRLPDPDSGSEVQLGADSLQVLDREVTFAAGATLRARRHPPRVSATVLDGQGFPGPAADQVIGELTLEGDATVSAAPRLRHASIRLSLCAAATSRLSYRSMRAFPATASSRQLAQALVAGACLPHLVRPAELEPGEVHSVVARMDLDLGLEVALGRELALPAELLERLPEPSQLEAEATIRAWLGLALRDDFRLEVGRARLQAPDRFRVRLERVHRRELSLGARLALDLAYELRPPLRALLDVLLASPGLTRVTDALRELHQLRDVVDTLATGNWAALRRDLSAEAAEVVADLLGRHGVWATVTSADAARALVDAARQLTDAVDRVDPLVLSLLDHLVRAKRLDPILEALGQIATVEDQDLESLLQPHWQPAVDLLEVLSGHDLESLVVGGEEVEEALARAATLARQAIDLHWRLEHQSPNLRKRLDAYFGETGPPRVLGAIEALASPEALQALAGRHVGRVVERLLARAVDEAGPTDLDRLKGWAARLKGLYEAGETDPFAAGLRAAVDQLEGELGFSAAIELDRLSRHGQLLDVEIDRDSSLADRVLGLLATGDLGHSLGTLLAAAGEDTEGDRLPFLLRDCALVSPRVRAGAVSLFSSLVGLEQRSRRRVTECTVKLTQDPRSSAFERHASYSGGLIASARTPDDTLTQLSAWLTYHGLGSGPDLDAPYDCSLKPELRLSVSRRDRSCSADELVALDELLHDLGFLSGPEHFRHLGADLIARFALTVRLPGEALDAFVACLDRANTLARHGWCRDFDNALHRWFLDRLDPVVDPWLKPPTRLGVVLADLVLSPWYRTTWTRSQQEVEEELVHGGGALTVPASHVTASDRITLQLPLRLVGGSTAPRQPYAPVLTVIGTRDQSVHAATELGRLARVATASRCEADLVAASGQAARAFAAATSLHWPNPMLLLWLLHARLCRKAPQLLERARGVATVRWKRRGAEGWEGLERLPLTAGLRVHPVGAPGSIFPI